MENVVIFAVTTTSLSVNYSLFCAGLSIFIYCERYSGLFNQNSTVNCQSFTLPICEPVSNTIVIWRLYILPFVSRDSGYNQLILHRNSLDICPGVGGKCFGIYISGEEGSTHICNIPYIQWSPSYRATPKAQKKAAT